VAGEGYRPAATIDQIAWLRCLLAISEAMAGHVERVREQLALAGGQIAARPAPRPNGPFHEQIRHLQAGTGEAAAFLRPFFAAYVAFLRRASHQELANFLAGRLGRLIDLIARDETRPGVVRALFHTPGSAGHDRFVHVSIERAQADTDPDARILHAGLNGSRIDAAMQEAARAARLAADRQLRRMGLPDGLDERVVRWELATAQGDAVGIGREYVGGSVALPLATAIVSEYLDRPVPRDVALTGAISGSGAEDGQVLPVDGVAEKLTHAFRVGCKLIYLPAGNAPILTQRPALKHLAVEHGARAVGVNHLAEVCDDLFPPTGSGRPKDLLRDVLIAAAQIARPSRASAEARLHGPVRPRHRLQAITCAVFMAAAVFLEGWMAWKAFAPGLSAATAWLRVAGSALVVLGGCGWAWPSRPPACTTARNGPGTVRWRC